MTPRAPARLRVLFAPASALAVVYRRGPAKWTQMWTWDTATDRFEAGQWINGYVHSDSTLSPDGRYLISRVMGGDQHTVLSRPPYFTALAVTVGTLCVTGAWFLADGAVRGGLDEVRTPGCPLRFVDERARNVVPIANHPIESTADGAFGFDGRGRKIAVREGKIGVLEGGETRWLVDLDPYGPENVPPPAWALEW